MPQSLSLSGGGWCWRTNRLHDCSFMSAINLSVKSQVKEGHLMGQMFNYSWISCVISVNGVRFRVTRGNSVRFEMMPGVLNVSPNTKYSWQHTGKNFLGQLLDYIVIIQSIRKLSCIGICLGVWMQFSFPS